MIVSCLIGGQTDIGASLQWQKSCPLLSGAPLFQTLVNDNAPDTLKNTCANAL